MSFRMLMAVRNKLLSAYQEVMRMHFCESEGRLRGDCPWLRLKENMKDAPAGRHYRQAFAEMSTASRTWPYMAALALVLGGFDRPAILDQQAGLPNPIFRAEPGRRPAGGDQAQGAEGPLQAGRRRHHDQGAPGVGIRRARLAMASAGLPKGGGVGFEVFNEVKIGTTEFVQKINYQRALQGELARTIARFSEVEQGGCI
jgi:flagellar M-ring protein FliF